MNIVIDIGGTHVRITASADFETVTNVDKFRTPKETTALKNAISESATKVLAGGTIDNICVGVPGIIDDTMKKFITIPNIPCLNNQYFSEILNFPKEKMAVKNDALLAALGEASRGAGTNYNCVAYLTLSTGVGGARIVGKKFDDTYKHFEPGHQIINLCGERYDSCGHNGCLESYVSGTAFEKRYGQKPQDCVDQNIWDEYAKNLAVGLLNVIAMWAPDVIVLGGSVSLQYDKFILPLTQNLNSQTFFKIPDIRKGETMDLAALYGGLFYLKSAFAVS